MFSRQTEFLESIVVRLKVTHIFLTRAQDTMEE